ncbi:GNAT family N-acetyltransferase [Nocardioides silvaticus]|uniref:GNAT family N-acetyltransferase n=1 Tax=Nocardioides silvaticus TaxID=2201891 RepID=A0A316TKB1_9ACTN|nr:GNAT family N-acetyltransferase [Nocardioides silvaticus]
MDAIEVPCRACLFWELDPVRRSRLDEQEARDVKESWMSEVLREWGSCGRVAIVDGVAVGYLTYAPPSYVPGAAQFPTAPASPDAVLLTTAYVADGYDGAGIGRLLVQGMARDLVGRGGIRAVEAFAHGGNRLVPDRGCLLPAEFLARVGFKTHRPHPRTPRMRMELRSLVSWRDEVEAAIERLVGAVRPAKNPSPAHREVD